MFVRAMFGVLLPLATCVARAQMDNYIERDQSIMLIPPPVSGKAYSTELGLESRRNYLHAGLTVSGAYNDNVVGQTINGRSVSDMSYSVWPTIAIDQTIPRRRWTFNYSPGFTIYQRTSALNQADHNLSFDSHFRVSPHVTLSLRDSLQKTSNTLNQPNPLSGITVSGSAQTSPVSVIAPAANQLTNIANAEVTYQFERDDMVGGQGTFTNLHYPDQSQVPGLYDSSSREGAGFYSHRISARQYAGATFQYAQILAYPTQAQTETNTSTILFFYTYYFNSTLSLSLSAGPQRFSVTQSSAQTYRSWSPAGAASMGWQARRASIAASYLRLVSGGGGLVGAFHSDNATVELRWQMARTWNVGSTASYSMNTNVTPGLFLATPGGHGIWGTVSTQHVFTEHLRTEFGYTRLHQSYSGIPLIANNPDTNRGFVSVTYQFDRPF